MFLIILDHSHFYIIPARLPQFPFHCLRKSTNGPECCYKVADQVLQVVSHHTHSVVFTLDPLLAQDSFYGSCFHI